MTATLALPGSEPLLVPGPTPAASNTNVQLLDGGLQCLTLLMALSGDAFDAERARREYLKPGR